MSENKDLGGFADQCANGHSLQGPVLFCPYCRVAQPPFIPTAPAAPGLVGDAMAGSARNQTDLPQTQNPPATVLVAPINEALAAAVGPGAAPIAAVAQPKRASPGKDRPASSGNPPIEAAPETRGLDLPAAGGAEKTPPSRPEEQEPKRVDPPRGKSPRPFLLVIGLAIAGFLLYIYFSGASRNDLVKVQGEMSNAVELAKACKLDEANTVLQTLTIGKASSKQQAQVRSEIAQATSTCELNRKRVHAWDSTRAAVDDAVARKNFELSKTLLRSFEQRWKADDESRALTDTLLAQQGSALLDDADDCLKKNRLECATQNLAKAETMNRAELKDRLTALQVEVVRAREAAASAPAVTAKPAEPIINQPMNFPSPRAAPAAPIVPAPSPPDSTGVAGPSAATESMLRDAEAAMNAGQFQEAKANAKMVLKMDPQNARARAMINQVEQVEKRAADSIIFR